VQLLWLCCSAPTYFCGDGVHVAISLGFYLPGHVTFAVVFYLAAACLVMALDCSVEMWFTQAASYRS
jgi:hypothetical protein